MGEPSDKIVKWGLGTCTCPPIFTNEADLLEEAHKAKTGSTIIILPGPLITLLCLKVEQESNIRCDETIRYGTCCNLIRPIEPYTRTLTELVEWIPDKVAWQ